MRSATPNNSTELDEAATATAPGSSVGFSAEQQNYLQGFFAGVQQRGLMPFVGELADGRLTATPASATTNLAAVTDSSSDAAEPLHYGTPLSELCREELWKYEQNGLDVWDKLVAHAAQDKPPAPDDLFRFKFYGLFYVAPAQDSFMLRLRAPGGTLSAAQMLGLADVAEQWGSGRCDLTTRANLQIRELQPRNIVRVLTAIESLGLTSRGSGADNIRNITASPLSGIDASELIETQPFATALQACISHSRDLFGLPRKFNIAFDGGGAISVLADTNDIGCVAVSVAESRSLPPGVYFRVLLAGITGHRQFAMDCGLLLRPEQVVAVAVAMVRVFQANGDRTDRKRARLKYLLDAWGVPRFLEETQKLLAFPMLTIPASECEPRQPIDRARHIGVHAQPQPGLVSIGVAVPVGRLPVAQMRALAQIAQQYGSGQLRLTVWQNLILPNIDERHLAAAQQALAAVGLASSAGPMLRGTVACTGNQGCRYAATDTKTHAVALATRLDERLGAQVAAPFVSSEYAGLSNLPINLHVTGCHHSCAQHYIGDIGLMGVKVGSNEGYQVLIGGGADQDQGLARELVAAIPFADLGDMLEQLLDAYAAERAAGESFLQFTRRHSIAQLRQFCHLKAAS